MQPSSNSFSSLLKSTSFQSILKAIPISSFFSSNDNVNEGLWSLSDTDLQYKSLLTIYLSAYSFFLFSPSFNSLCIWGWHPLLSIRQASFHLEIFKAPPLHSHKGFWEHSRESEAFQYKDFSKIILLHLMLLQIKIIALVLPKISFYLLQASSRHIRSISNQITATSLSTECLLTLGAQCLL